MIAMFAYATGCASTKTEYDYLGKVPFYAKKELTPAPPSAILEEQQSKKEISMNISRKAKSCGMVLRKSGHQVDDSKIIPSHNNRFHGFGSVVTDCLMAQQEEADRRLAQIKLRRAGA